MPVFFYTAMEPEEGLKSGIIEAVDRETAMKQLSTKNLIVTKLTLAQEKKGILSTLFGMGDLKVKPDELLGFTQQLSVLFEAGIPIKRAITAMINDSDSPSMKKILIDISTGLSSGSSLSELLSRYPSVFSRLYVSMVTAGEASGKLSEVLGKLAEFIEKSEHLKNKVKGALYYPSLVISFAVIVMISILAFGIPIFKNIYDGFDAPLPAPTRIFINVGNFCLTYWYVFVILMVMLFAGFKFFITSERGGFLWDSFKLRLPIVGRILKKLMIARFARTLSFMYSSGIPLIQSMEMISATAGNRAMENLILDSLKNWKEGETIADPLRRSKLFTNLAITMIATGEESGGLSMMMDKLTHYYEVQIETEIFALASLLEPLIMIVLGVFIGFIIIVLGMPFLNISNIINK